MVSCGWLFYFVWICSSCWPGLQRLQDWQLLAGRKELYGLAADRTRQHQSSTSAQFHTFPDWPVRKVRHRDLVFSDYNLSSESDQGLHKVSNACVKCISLLCMLYMNSKIIDPSGFSLTHLHMPCTKFESEKPSCLLKM